VHGPALTDELTGAYNRRHFVRQLEQMAERATLWSGTFSVVLIDIDQFKRINDTYGHKAGDDALRVVSRICRENLRKLDVFARYGGEEFAFLLYDTDIDQAVAITARIQQQLDVTPVEHAAASFTLTFSAGIAGWRGTASDADGLLQAADQALYAAKRGGRNQVRVADLTPALPTPEGIYEHQRG
jgi:diguanylate cyclase (GGDEF)-like protein